MSEVVASLKEFMRNLAEMNSHGEVDVTVSQSREPPGVTICIQPLDKGAPFVMTLPADRASLLAEFLASDRPSRTPEQVSLSAAIQETVAHTRPTA